jgi:FkbM family methyltransferase
MICNQSYSNPEMTHRRVFTPFCFGPSAPALTVRTTNDEALYAKAVKEHAWGVFWAIQHILLHANASAGHSNVVLDWGVNFGFLSIMAAKLGFTVIGVEAHPWTFRQMQHNLFLNCVQHSVHVFNVGLGKANGTVLMSNSLVSGANSISELARKRASEIFDGFHDKESFPIAVRTWDDLVTQTKHRLPWGRRAYLLKIDIEGSEVNGLKGARSYLQAYPPHYIAFENNWNAFVDHGLELVTMVRDMGYALYHVGLVDAGLGEGTFPKLTDWANFHTRPFAKDIPSFFASQTYFTGDLIGVHRDTQLPPPVAESDTHFAENKCIVR